MVMLALTSFLSTTLNCLIFFNVQIAEPRIKGRAIEIDWGGVVILVGGLIALLWILWWTKEEESVKKAPGPEKNTCPGTCGLPWCKGLSEHNYSDCILADQGSKTHDVVCVFKEGIPRPTTTKPVLKGNIHEIALSNAVNTPKPSDLGTLTEHWHVYCGRCLKPHPCNPNAPSYKSVRNTIPKILIDFKSGWRSFWGKR